MDNLSKKSTYEAFTGNINHYLNLYDRGLKKQANKYLADLMIEFQVVYAKEQQEEMLYTLCSDVCDNGHMEKLLNRGNSSLPHSLRKVVWEYLKEQSSLGNMPQMRWIYELYHYNTPHDLELDVYEVLKKAFDHGDCDQKTIDLYFDTFLERLSYGAHHFPDCCLIEKSEFDQIIKDCQTIISNKDIKVCQQKELDFFYKLYSCYFNYENNSKTEDFNKLCNDAGIDFSPTPTYYY